VKPFYSERIASKLMTKNTSLLTKNTAFEDKLHFDTTKCDKRQNGVQFTTISAKNLTLSGQKQLDLEEKY
jgi:hypothetical protein